MVSKQPPNLRRSCGSRRRQIPEQVIALLKKAWQEMGYCGSKHLKGALVDWLPYFDEYDQPTCQRLMRMSASTMDLYLAGDRAQLKRKLNTGTKRSKSRHVMEVPIRALDQKPIQVGHCAVDLVAHCGDSLSGKFAWTLTLTDIVSGHTENEAVWGKDGYVVMCALRRIEQRLPFNILALYFDNGTEFMNDDVINRYAKNPARPNPLQVFRSRPYKKNDQCFVEQKNFTHVRDLFGYDRMDWKKGRDFMNNIYCTEWRNLNNFFRPQIKLIRKWRAGSKIKKQLSQPLTPYARLLASAELSDIQKQSLIETRKTLNPRNLRKKLKRKLRDFQGYLGKQYWQLTKQAA